MTMTARSTSSSSKWQRGEGKEKRGVDRRWICLYNDRKGRKWEYNKARKGKVKFQRIILDMCFS